MSDSSLFVSAQTAGFNLPPGKLYFVVGGKTVMEFHPDGLIFIRGEQVDSNQEVYRQMVVFLGLCAQSLAAGDLKLSPGAPALTLSPEALARLDTLAADRGQTPSEVVLQLVRNVGPR